MYNLILQYSIVYRQSYASTVTMKFFLTTSCIVKLLDIFSAEILELYIVKPCSNTVRASLLKATGKPTQLIVKV